MSEFTRLYDARQLPGATVALTATPAECTALARRFALVAVRSLAATVDLHGKGGAVEATGQLVADIIQSCAVSGDDLPVRIAERVALRFVPARTPVPDEEVELAPDELDEIEFAGTQFDLGEALAQSLALAIDPFAVGPGADEVRRTRLHEPGADGPFAALARLKKD